jgi:hypothetical protein
MTQPLRIDALEELALDFRRVAENLTDVADRQRRGFASRGVARSMRPALAVVFATVALAGTAGAGVYLLVQGDPIPPAPSSDFTADQQPVTGSERLSGVQTADPTGGPPWGLQLYRSEGGRQCYIVGRVLDSKVGVIRGGIHRPLPLRGPGTCVRPFTPDRPLNMETRAFGADGEEHREVIAGIAGPTVASIEFDDGNSAKTVVPGPDGEYLAVFSGYPRVKRTVHFTDGSSQVLTPPATDGAPSGAP